MEEKEMKLLGLFAVGIIVLSLIVVTGLVVMNRFDYSLRESATVSGVAISLSTVTVPVLVGSSGTYPYLASATNCMNATNGAMLFNSSYYSITEGSTSGGYLTLLNVTSGTPVNGTYWQNSNINCTVTYRKATTQSEATSYFSTGLTTFGVFVELLILAYIGKIIIKMFKKGV